jgi:hypothetical protein
MTTRTVYLKDRLVQTIGGGKEAMSQALAGLEAKTSAGSASSPMAQSRGKLAQKANLYVLFDLPGTIGRAIQLVSESGALPFLPIDPAMFNNPDARPSYMGMSVGTESAGLRVKTFIPLAQMQGIARIVQAGMALQGGQIQIEEEAEPATEN